MHVWFCGCVFVLCLRLPFPLCPVCCAADVRTEPASALEGINIAQEESEVWCARRARVFVDPACPPNAPGSADMRVAQVMQVTETVNIIPGFSPTGRSSVPEAVPCASV